MSLLIAFHSPAIGYCISSDAFFVGDHHVDGEACSDDCHGHEQEEPVEHEHFMFVFDAGDFQWSAAPLCMVPQFFELEVPAWFETLNFVSEEDLGELNSRPNPPPPDVPIFRRDAALRV